MPRKPRIEKRLRAEQPTVGQQRAERQEQEELIGEKMRESTRRRALRTAPAEAEQPLGKGAPPRLARPSKPLKR